MLRSLPGPISVMGGFHLSLTVPSELPRVLVSLLGVDPCRSVWACLCLLLAARPPTPTPQPAVPDVPAPSTCRCREVRHPSRYVVFGHQDGWCRGLGLGSGWQVRGWRSQGWVVAASVAPLASGLWSTAFLLLSSFSADSQVASMGYIRVDRPRHWLAGFHLSSWVWHLRVGLGDGLGRGYRYAAGFASGHVCRHATTWL